MLRAALSSFTDFIEEARGYVGDLRDVVEMVVERSGLIEELQALLTPMRLTAGQGTSGSSSVSHRSSR